MSSSLMLRKALVGAAALAVLALGGSALAGAAIGGGSSAAQQGDRAANGAPRRDPTVPGGHRGANGKIEAALPAAAAAKVRAAARAEVKDGTVERVESDVDHGSPYEAHARMTDGTELEVLVDRDFKVTAVNPMPQT